MPKSNNFLVLALVSGSAAAPVMAQDAVPDHALSITDGATFTPLIEARLRWEDVDQKTTSRRQTRSLRVSEWGELSAGLFAFLAESEATLGLDNDYNSGTNGRTRYSVVSDPQNIEFNRLQLAFTGISKTAITVGRQRLNIDDQRWVGSVGWRQNEQTFDAVRLQSKLLGLLDIDVAACAT